MIQYRRTQVSWPVIIPMATMAVFVGGVFVAIRFMFPLVLTAAVLTVVLLLFATMTVIVDDSAVEARFGVGIIRKRVPFDRIRACRVVRNQWYYGWGIHVIPGGTLYNALGLSAVELQLTNGGVVRIGSGEPETLAAVLRPAAPEAAAAAELETRGMPGIVVAIPLVIAGAFAIVGVMIYTGMRPPAVQVTGDSFSVSNGAYSNTIAFRRIESLALQDSIPRVRLRTNGFASGETLRGSFRVDSWGNARLYVNLNHPPFVVVRSDDGVVAVNFVNPQQTRDVYAELRQALDRSR